MNNFFFICSLCRSGGAPTEFVHLPHRRTVLHIAGICHSRTYRFRHTRPGPQGTGETDLSKEYRYSDYCRAGHCDGNLSEHCGNHKRVQLV